jgi:hypothetical protein
MNRRACDFYFLCEWFLGRYDGGNLNQLLVQLLRSSSLNWALDELELATGRCPL